MTVFLTTQYLEEADQLTDRIAVIDGGLVVAEGTPSDLKSLRPPPNVSTSPLSTGRRSRPWAEGSAPGCIHRDPDQLTVGVATDGTAAHVRALSTKSTPEAAPWRGSPCTGPRWTTSFWP